MEARDKFEPFRTFVFLQGPPTGFWSKLASALSKDGHRVLKVNFSLADRVFWNAGNCQTFRGPFNTWSDWFENFVRVEGVTDLLYFNDGFPYHRIANKIALKNGLRPWCLEFGYLRPDWIALELDGLNRRSRFPTLPSDIRDIARLGSETDSVVRFEHSFLNEAIHEVSFNMLQSLGCVYNPRFRSDKRLSPLLQYIGWFPRILKKPLRKRNDGKALRSVSEGNQRYMLVAMQMTDDYEVRDTRFGNVQSFLENVLRSFARDAPADLQLIIKSHPLEGGWINWKRRVTALSRSLRIEQRVIYTELENLDALLNASSGLVVMNSTSGLKALQLGIPVIAMGEPIYDRSGLTHQGSLKSFWSTPTPVDQEFLTEFLRALSLIQVKGSFYDPEGQELAIKEIRARLSDNGPHSVPGIFGSRHSCHLRTTISERSLSSDSSGLGLH